jgi:hypothetical protein
MKKTLTLLAAIVLTATVFAQLKIIVNKNFGNHTC